MTDFENKKSTDAPQSKIDENFREAQSNITSLIQKEEFQAACSEAGIDPFDDSDPEYWQIVKNQSEAALESAWNAGVIDELEYKTHWLVFAAPDYVMSQGELYANPPEDKNEYYTKRATTSQFISRIQDFAKTFPAASVSALRESLVDTISATLYEDDIIQAGDKYIKDAIRGVQHELAFRQILEQTSFDFRETTIEEDVGGADFVIEPGTTDAKLDVKASLKKINSMGETTQSFAHKAHGDIMMYSYVHDKELGDSFFISDYLAAEKAQMVEPDLQRAVSQTQVGYHQSAT